MEHVELDRIRLQLVDRRDRLNYVMSNSGAAVHLVNLLKEVDAALERMNDGTYGVCIVCQGEIEKDRLLINPLLTVCLDDMDSSQRRVLETDLDLARKIQTGMLPKNNLSVNGWELFYHYEPAGAVSGDYCDVISAGVSSPPFFILGDVSGKGIAASMLMSHLHAMFHSMVPLGLGVTDLVEHASSLLCESTMSLHYATLLCIKAESSGEIELCNAGHVPPLLLQKGKVQRIDATGLPIGLFCDSGYSVHKTKLESGDTLLLYTDGLNEAFFKDEAYGIDRLMKFVDGHYSSSPRELTNKILADVNNFVAGELKKDDLTIMAIRKL